MKRTKLKSFEVAITPPTIEKHDGFIIVRDDHLIGGTKLRYLHALFRICRHRYLEWVCASPTFGYTQIAVPAACKLLGLKATVFVPARKTEPHPYTKLSLKLGADIHWVDMGMQTVLEKRARDYVESQNYRAKVPFGGMSRPGLEEIARTALSLNVQPKEVWCSISSGVLCRGLQLAWPKAKFFGVVVGHKPTEEERGNAELLQAPEKYSGEAKHPPPFPSCPYYDAKVWRFMKENGGKDALMWNLGA